MITIKRIQDIFTVQMNNDAAISIEDGELRSIKNMMGKGLITVAGGSLSIDSLHDQDLLRLAIGRRLQVLEKTRAKLRKL